MLHFNLPQRLHAVGHPFDITDDTGKARYHLAAPWFRVPQTFVLRRAEGDEVLQIRRALFSLRTTMQVMRNGARCASVRRALLPWRGKYVISEVSGHALVAEGDVPHHEYELRRAGETVARVSRNASSDRGGYGIDVLEGEDAPLLLAVAVALDEMTHEPLGEDRARPAR